MDVLENFQADQMYQTTKDAKGKDLDSVKQNIFKPTSNLLLTVLWFLKVTYHVCMYMVFSNMVK